MRDAKVSAVKRILKQPFVKRRDMKWYLELCAATPSGSAINMAHDCYYLEDYGKGLTPKQVMNRCTQTWL